MGGIISVAREFIKFNAEKIDLNQIIKDKNSDPEMIELAKKDLEVLKRKIITGFQFYKFYFL